MATRLTPYEVGEVLSIRGPRDGSLVVYAPDGLELRVPAPTGRADLWLAQPGSWRYVWGDEERTLEVVEPEPGEPAELEQAPDAGPRSDMGRIEAA